MNISISALGAISIAIAISTSACSSSNSATAAVDEESNPDSAMPQNSVSQGSSDAVGTSQNAALSNLGSSQMPDASTDQMLPLRLDFVAHQLLESLGGYSLDLLAERVAVISEVAASTAINSTELEAGSYEIDDQAEIVNIPVVRTQFQCAFGGEVLIESTHAEFWGESYSRDLTRTIYRFDQCVLSLGGEQIVNGSMSIFSDIFFANRVSSKEQTLAWDNFSWFQGGGSSVSVHASIGVSDIQAFDASASRTVTIERYESSLDGSLIEQVTNGRFFLSNTTSEAGDVQGYFLQADGQVMDQSAVPVIVVTEPPMRRKIVFGGVNVEPILFNGQIMMTADDGSQLVIEAISKTDTLTLLVDTTYVDSSGGVTSETAQNFVNLAISVN